MLNNGNKFDLRSLLVITNKKDQSKKISNSDLIASLPIGKFGKNEKMETYR